MDALAALLKTGADEDFRLSYIAQALWMAMRIGYKEPPMESYMALTDRMRPDRQRGQTAEELKESLLAKLRKG